MEKLLKLSSKCGTKRLSVEPLFEHIENSKRHYEPKGRNLLKKKPKKNNLTDEKTVFTEKDFEKFSTEYFLNSKPIVKSNKVNEIDDDLD